MWHIIKNFIFIFVVGDYFEVSLADLTSLPFIEILWNSLLRPIRRMVYNVNILILFKSDSLIRFIHSKI